MLQDMRFAPKDFPSKIPSIETRDDTMQIK